MFRKQFFDNDGNPHDLHRVPADMIRSMNRLLALKQQQSQPFFVAPVVPVIIPEEKSPEENDSTIETQVLGQ